MTLHLEVFVLWWGGLPPSLHTTSCDSWGAPLVKLPFQHATRSHRPEGCNHWMCCATCWKSQIWTSLTNQICASFSLLWKHCLLRNIFVNETSHTPGAWARDPGHTWVGGRCMEEELFWGNISEHICQNGLQIICGCYVLLSIVHIL